MLQYVTSFTTQSQNFTSANSVQSIEPARSGSATAPTGSKTAVFLSALLVALSSWSA